jgi:tripartite-type tricarboxylate transporter receptor subunit TctC
MRQPVAVAAALLSATALLLPSLSGASAQSARAIKLINPYPPGGGADVLARVLVNEIGDLGGPTLVVENRPGAGTVIGTQDAVRAAPDGNTLLITNNALLLAPHMRKLDFDPLTGLEPICGVGSTPTVVIVNSASPYHTLSELIAAARQKAGGLTFGAGIGALSQVTYAMLMHRADFNMTLVPFTGTPPEVEAVFGGHVDTAFVDYPPAQGLLQAGKLRALATGSGTRTEWLPDVPTVSELGYPGFEIDLWYGVFAPAHTPSSFVAQMAGWLTKATRVPKVKTLLRTQGIATSGECGAPFAADLRKRFDEYGQVIRDAHIKTE